MKNKILLIMALFIATQFASAQTEDYKFSVGLNVLRTEYIGDYGSAFFNFEQNMNIGLGLSLGYYVNPSFDFGLQTSYGKYGYKEDLVNRFQGQKLDGSLYAHYKLNNGYILSKDSKFAPFISLGFGVASYGIDLGLDKSEVNPALSPLIIVNGIDLIVPAGLGLKYQVTDLFAIQYQYLYNFTNSDVHDQNRSGGVVNTVFGTSAHPYNKAGNDAFGQHVFSLVFNFGKLKDTDKDGIADKFDICPETPLEIAVDDKGCPFDTDGDGVADYLDKCAMTPAGVNVDAKGCPIDADRDGIADYLDKCSNTPSGVKVDAVGCPIDTDGDGVADYMDKCPNSPKGFNVDATGCTVDTDGDGVVDNLDKCPNSQKGAKVDENGCEKDTDGDGVVDYLDKCPGTPVAAYGKVDVNGCPTDTDGDGIPDYQDNCPTIAGKAIDNGCPEVKKEVKELFKKALQGIQFETGKSDIKPTSYPLLNQIANILILNPTYLIEVQGHTDNVGGDDFNLNLSNERAASVRGYLVSKGISETKITSHGYGETQPVASNNTKVGKTLNRRVEFVVTFEK
ncbi:MAG: thrombospondin type 3 repeat-containing protein [Paludibacter sp.]|nr:thrombospondin type 3 repeat-containing protein [Paludibacter sp.]